MTNEEEEVFKEGFKLSEADWFTATERHKETGTWRYANYMACREAAKSITEMPSNIFESSGIQRRYVTEGPKVVKYPVSFKNGAELLDGGINFISRLLLLDRADQAFV